ncbi:MAG TPA: hypothetical protein VMF12_19995 [Xanthobacteraceae bacterium]|nr:hypothetical protein [Xanthobacteraceae bacterium]
MFTFGPVGALGAPRSASFAGAALALSLLGSAAPTAAHAQMIESGGCVNGWYSFNCVTRWAPAGDPFVREVPQPLDQAARALAKERDRRWVNRCKPTIEQDRYGVPRYRYAVPGCEFGVGEF